MPLIRWIGGLCCALMLAWAPLTRAAELPVPALLAHVTDTTGQLSAAQRDALERKLSAFEQVSGPQIAVLLVHSTLPEDIASYSFRVADNWKLGRREVGDGLLIVVAVDDRKVRIEVAKALEGAVPDLAARQIIERQIRPAFRAGDYAGGLNAGIDQLMQRLRGEQLPAPTAPVRTAGDGAPAWDQLLLLMFIAVPVLGSVLKAVLGRGLGSVASAAAAGVAAWWFSASLWLGAGAALMALLLVGMMGGAGGLSRRSGRGGFGPVIWGGGGGGGGSGGGGGFSSGGGGDFGGGGASGDW